MFLSRVFGGLTEQAILALIFGLVLKDMQDAVFPGWWINEGGQSSTGQVCPCIHLPSRLTEGCSQLIDFVISSHPAHRELKDLSEYKGIDIHEGS